MWMLVVIIVAGMNAEVMQLGTYDMITCFDNRNTIWESFPGDKTGYQAVCVRITDTGLQLNWLKPAAIVREIGVIVARAAHNG